MAAIETPMATKANIILSNWTTLNVRLKIVIVRFGEGDGDGSSPPASNGA
jgi:hypothetical protein